MTTHTALASLRYLARLILASIVLGALVTLVVGPREIRLAFEAFGATVVGVFVCYVLVGLPVHRLLERFGQRASGSYLLAGALVALVLMGAVITLLPLSDQPPLTVANGLLILARLVFIGVAGGYFSGGFW